MNTLSSHILIVLLTLLTACTPKKQEVKNPDLSDWLEIHFPGKFKIIDNSRSLRGRDLIENRRTSVIASVEDPMLQFRVTWNKNREEIGVTKEEIDSSYANSVRDIKYAREFAEMLKMNGINKTSVGVIDEAVYILPFSEPDKKTRDEFTVKIFELLKHRTAPQTSIWIEWMEDSIYGKEFTDVIPNGYWYRGDNWHERHKILSLDFELTPEVTATDVKDGWEFNTGSDRSMIYLHESYPQALTWAEKNIKTPFYLEESNMVQFSGDENDRMAVHYFFPLLEEKIELDSMDEEGKIKGYVTGMYQVDKKQFSNIKKVDEL